MVAVRVKSLFVSGGTWLSLPIATKMDYVILFTIIRVDITLEENSILKERDSGE